MIQFTGIDSRQQNIYSNKQNNPARKAPNMQLKAFAPVKNKKIGVAEGAELFLSGVLKQGKEMVTSIIKHPLKSAALIAGTSIAIMALPLIGIPSAVGGGVLAIGFAGYAVGKAVYHASLFAKSNKKGTYDLARYHLQQLGEDTFDVALSAPFVPKAVTNMKNFAKYGKIGVNNALINELKSSDGFVKKFKTIAKADAEMSRNLNFQSAVDKEIATLKDLTDAQKAQIKAELLEFNIAAEEIPKLVLEKYGQARGVTTQPDIVYTTMAPTTHGSAVANNCKIHLNDYKPYAGKSAFADYKCLHTELNGSDYVITYTNVNTGAITVERIDAQILNKYNELCAMFKELSPESAKILTILHEREHIHQFAQVCGLKGFGWLKAGVSPRGKALYEQMLAEMPKPTPQEMAKIFSYMESAANGTPAAYIRLPLEIGAREIEHQALNNQTFLALDKVFKTMKYSKNNLSLGENILLNDLRLESSKV